MTYVVNATTAILKPGNTLENMTRLENTGCLRHASLFAQGSRNNGRFDMVGFYWTGLSSILVYVNLRQYSLVYYGCQQMRQRILKLDSSVVV